jgi:DUF4097 and DUF4098 domain-containing protein YvlB
MKQKNMTITGLLLVTAMLATGAGLNESIRVGSGETRDGDLTTVNGSITVGDDAQINGECTTVNGSIKVGDDVEVESLTTVNGGVNVGSGTVVRRDVQTVNGSITLDNGAKAAAVSNINGRITLKGADVDGDISTINGDVDVRNGARVGGDIIVGERNGDFNQDEPIKITVSGDSVVEGNIINEEDDIEVEVHIEDGGRVMGKVEGATVIEK